MNENYIISKLKEIGIDSSRAVNTSEKGICQTDNSFDIITKKVLKEPNLLNEIKKLVSELLSIDKNNEHYWSLMGYINDLENNFEKEIGCIYKALEINSANINNWSDLAFAYRNLEDFEMYEKVLFNMDELSIYFSKFTKKEINKEILQQTLIDKQKLESTIRTDELSQKSKISEDLEILRNRKAISGTPKIPKEFLSVSKKFQSKIEKEITPDTGKKNWEHVQIEITRDCNHDCIFCSTKKSEKYLSREIVIQEMEHYKKEGVKNLIFTGGEPTLHPDLLELVKKAVDMGFNLRIITNGTNLDKALIKKLISNGLKWFLVSVHTIDKEKHHELTTKDDFNKTLNALEILSKKDIKLEINITIIKQNYKQLYDIIKFLKRKFPRISHVNFNFVVNEGLVEGKKEILPKVCEVELYLDKAMEFCKKNNIHFFCERVPLCYMLKYAAHSSETQRIVMNFQYGINFLEDKTVRRVNTMWNYVKSDACKTCKLNEICSGLIKSYVNVYGTDELYPIFDDPKPIVEEVFKINKLDTNAILDENIKSLLEEKIKSKVSIRKCEDYDLTLLKEAIRKSLDDLGGLNKFIKPGEKVLIKPNLIDPLTPDKAATTNPLFLKAVIQLVKEITNYVWIGESSGGTLPESTDKAYIMSGIRNVAEEEKISFINFQRQEFIARDILNYQVLERTDFAHALFEADAIINLPKLKTHGITFFTGAVKNFLGCIHPQEREYLHREFCNRHDFSKGLVDIYSFLKRKVKLNIMDAVVGMEGDQGPSYGDPRKIGLVIVSNDAVALDAVASEIVGYNPLAILTTKNAHERNIGCGDLKDIEILGENLEDVKVNDFKKNSLFDFINTKKKEKGYGKEFIFEPVFIENCLKCETCKINCPVNAITFNPEGIIDRKKCIHCYCCHEVCPYGGLELKKKKEKRN